MSERCEHFRRMSRGGKKEAYVVRENSFLDEKEAKSVVSGQAGNREASAAPGMWARDHTAVASGLFQEGPPRHQG